MFKSQELCGIGVTMLSFVVPSHANGPTLLLSNGLACSYYGILAQSGHTIEQFESFVSTSRLLKETKDAQDSQSDYSGTGGRDAMRKVVNSRLLDLLSKLQYCTLQSRKLTY